MFVKINFLTMFALDYKFVKNSSIIFMDERKKRFCIKKLRLG